MTHALTTAQTLARLAKRLNELGAWRDARRQTLTSGEFFARGAGQAQPILVGDAWPSRDFPVTLRFRAEVPAAWSGPLALRFDVGGEGLLSVNGAQIGGLNPYHHEYRLGAEAAIGGVLDVEIQASPKDLFGRPAYRPVLKVACLVQPDEEVRTLHGDLAAALGAARQLLARGQPDLADQLVGALDEVFRQVPIERGGSAAYLARAVQQPDQAAEIASIWDEWDFAREDLPAFPDELRPALRQARAFWQQRLAGLLERFPPLGALSLTGHAHIDLAWLWPLSETRRKAVRTFSSVLSLMEQYPDFTFNQSSAQLYRFMEEDAPELFDRIRQRVAEGRWDVVGGMWVEPDGNLISGESWARQLLYGQRYFREKFGQTARVCWLPDTFGYAANLPQLLNLAQMPYFFTTKLTWNETNTFPHDLYQWEGLDGSRVVAHSFFNPDPAMGYNGDIAPTDTLQTWQNFRGKRTHTESLLSFGYGDGGGGPTAEMLERYARLQAFPGLPRLRMRRVADFYGDIEWGALPIWWGEQYLELHRGTYTAQARVKALNRRLEHTLTEAESACALAQRLAGQSYPRTALGALWEILLRNQFHDILPGSGVRAVYDVAHQELGAALEDARQWRGQALQVLSDVVGGPGQMVVWNLSSDDRRLRAVLSAESGLAASYTVAGQPVQGEQLDGVLTLHGNVTVPGLGYLRVDVGNTDDPQPSSPPFADDLTLENTQLRAVIGEDGTVASLIHKGSGRELLSGRGNQLWAYVDLAREWDAWELDAAYAQEGQELLAEARPERLPGTLSQRIRVRRRHGQSSITQIYELSAGSARLDIHTEVDWQGRHTLLRTLSPVAVRSAHATFETAFGSVTRTTHTNTSWDAAQFEVPGHRWADLSDGAAGLGLLTDSKYGYSCKGNLLGLSLLRAPVFPDPTADEGQHRFSYALYPHAGDWRNGTVREAHDLNAPLLACRSEGAAGERVQVGTAVSVRLLGLPPGLRLSALKLAEDSDALLLRVYEAHGQSAALDLEDELGVRDWRAVNLLEEPLPGGERPQPVTAYQVVTLLEQL
ncbi:alpha-mannosidase [Deinococcus alpinitundrae]|uniref:alpha-mannosidase n=1 Tax=Deinococcus alpinitundrae TaxID=468913 RepID=UPI00137A1FB9|nr:alpha-mannosidase [Deinococcus alpinitundrae]